MKQINKGYNGNKNLKPEGLNIPWTEETLREYNKCMEDPIYFIRTYMKIVSLDHGLVNFDMYDYQEDLIKTYIEKNRILTLSIRQSGKCFIDSHYINIRNKKTGEIKKISIGEFYEQQKSREKM